MRRSSSQARMWFLITASSAALGLAACGGRDTQDEPAAAPTAEMAPAHDMAASPFLAAEMAMNEKMMAASSSTPEHTWAMKMVAHHQGAVDMSKVLLAQSPTGPMREMAQKTVDDQTKEIAELQAWMQANKAPAGAAANPFGSAEMRMHERMKAIAGADVDQTWARKMIEHHQGAVDTANIVLKDAKNAEMKRIAQMTSDKQTREISMLRSMISK